LKENQNGRRWMRAVGYIHGNIDSIMKGVSATLNDEELYQILVGVKGNWIGYCDEWALPIEIDMPFEGKIEGGCSKILTKYQTEIDVCTALRILANHVHSISVFHAPSRKLDLEIYGFTTLGIEFMRACRPE
jgi:hypothetical protein